MKGKVYEGGIKVPFYLKFPKIHGNNGKDINSLSAHIDVLPSLLNLCDIEIPKEKKLMEKIFLNKPLKERSFFLIGLENPLNYIKICL